MPETLEWCSTAGCRLEQQVTHVCQVAYWHLHMHNTHHPLLHYSGCCRETRPDLCSLTSELCHGTTTGAAGLPHLPAAESAECCCEDGAVRAGRRDHISSILKRLHWLPIRQRIVYKALVLTFRGLHGLAPKYISVHLHKPSSKTIVSTIWPWQSEDDFSPASAVCT